MMTPFAKLNGLGNDFVFFNDLDDQLHLDEQTVRWLCDRHRGIGGDGVILVKPSPRPECIAFMHYINSDGSLAQMCGNGVRCFAKYLVDRGIADPASGSLIADTPAGPRPIAFTLDEGGHLLDATVNMGRPRFEPEEIPVDAACDSMDERVGDYVGALELESPWGVFGFTCVSMGNPHAVCFIDDFANLAARAFINPEQRTLESLDVASIGAFFESHPAFPEKTNVEFVDPTDSGLNVRVYERGCAETLACGTGACATLVAAVLDGYSATENVVRLPGGELTIRWLDDLTVSMRGRADQSFTGEVDLPFSADT